MPTLTALGAWLDTRLPDLLAEYDHGTGRAHFLPTDRADRGMNR